MRGTGAAIVCAIGVLAGGCFDPQLHPGQECASGLCPDGLECIDGFCQLPGTPGADAPVGGADAGPGTPDAPIDGNPGVDSDGDGVDDSTDNCVMMPNPTQHDEDSDLVGDPCDRCPYITLATPDTDGDGIGDACDPRPANPNDVRDRFYGFDVMPSDGNGIGGTWTVSGDDLIYGGAATSRFAIAGTRGHVYVVMGGVVTSAAMSCELKLIAGTTAGNTYTSCAFDDDPGAPTLEIEDEAPGGTTVLKNTPRPDPLDLAPYQLIMTASPVDDLVTCVGTEGGDMVSVTAPDAVALTDGQVEILSRNTGVAVHYLFIVVMN